MHITYHLFPLVCVCVCVCYACRWLPSCASLFVTFKDSWLPLVPKKASIAPVKAQKLFFCVAALMSLQLRSLVVASLQDLLQFFQLHQVLKPVTRLHDTFCFKMKSHRLMNSNIVLRWMLNNVMRLTFIKQ